MFELKLFIDNWGGPEGVGHSLRAVFIAERLVFLGHFDVRAARGGRLSCLNFLDNEDGSDYDCTNDRHQEENMEEAV